MFKRQSRVTAILIPCLLALAAMFPEHADTASAEAIGATLSLGAAVNKAGRQRMLTQRIVKAYGLVGLGVRREESRRELVAAVTQFDSQLDALKGFSTHPAVVDAIAAVEVRWGPFKAVALGAVGRDGARSLHGSSEPLLQAAERVVRALEVASTGPYARLVNISGRQRMLSQRLAKLYVLRAWGFMDASLLEQMDRASNEFDGALLELSGAPENDAVVARLLIAVGEQWQWLKSALTLQKDDAFFPFVVDDASRKTLDLMEAMTRHYQRLSDR